MKLKTNYRVIKEIVKEVLFRINLIPLYFRDMYTFNKYASYSFTRIKLLQVQSKIDFNVHSLEKGLSMKNLRFNFGKRALSNLNDALVMHIKLSNSDYTNSFKEGISILRAYKTLHEKSNVIMTDFYKVVDMKILEEYDFETQNGTYVVTKDAKKLNSIKNFKELAIERHSIRDFSGEKISFDKIEEALIIAQNTPSVCNRQGWGVTVVDNKDLISKVLEIQGGYKGYSNVPEALILVCSNISAFLDPTERNEPFIDGGLYSMSLIYSFEYLGIGAVPLNAMLKQRDEKRIRKLLQIPQNQRIIMFIALGEFREVNLVPKSNRKPYTDYTRFIS